MMLASQSVALVAALLVAQINAQACSQSGGNWYCNQVQAVEYTNFGSSGTFNQVTSMNENNGQCSFSPSAYSGAMAPFDQELSIHIRGPFSLKQFAFYTPPTTSTGSISKRGSTGPPVRREKPIQRIVKGSKLALRDILERTLTTVHCPTSNGTTYSINGKKFVIECAINRPGTAMSTSKQSSFAACIQQCSQTKGCAQISYQRFKGGLCNLKSTTSSLHPQDFVRGIFSARLVTQSSDKQGYISSNTSSSSSNIYTRQSYYNSATQAASGVTFMNNLGGGSFPGIWSPTFGNSLTYASSCGLKPAMSPTVLSDTTLPSTSEISLWSSAPCTSSNPCPYYRPGSVANHGFGGANKIFLFEFSMPHDTSPGAADMPALWFLNARIPRTQQYGACSCWGNTNGCGELDAFEVLTPGENRMISSVHGIQAMTDPNWFARPVQGTVKAAVALVGGRAVLRVLDSSFDFSSGLVQAQVDAILSIGTSVKSASMALPN